MPSSALYVPLIHHRISDPALLKTLQPQDTGIASPAGSTQWRGIIAGCGQGKINTQSKTVLYDFSFCHLDERCMYLKNFALNPRL